MNTRRMVCLPLLLVLILALHCNGQESGLILEVGGDGKRFVSLEDGIVSFHDGSSTALSDLPVDAQKEVMNFTGWGRVWEDKSGKHHTIADLVSVSEKSIVLEKANGHEIIVPIDSLSKLDSDYVAARKKLHSDVLPEHFRAKVVGVSDGDTVTVLLNRKQHKVRIAGIDAPEKGQAFGAKSRKHLSNLVFGKIIRGSRESVDQYGRNVCELELEGKRIDHDMLRSGLAWHYTKFSSDQTRQAMEDEAKSKELNIWSESGPIQPWEWRRWGAAKRKQFVASQEPPREPVKSSEPPPVKKTTLSHWLNSNGNVRHNSSCRWFQNTKRGRMCGAHEGRGCKKCGG